MATTTWSISKEEHDVSEGYISMVHWNCVRVDGDYSANAYGSVELAKPDTLIPYATFNKQSTLVAAVKEKLGADQVKLYEDGVTLTISEQKTPTMASSVPPA